MSFLELVVESGSAALPCPVEALRRTLDLATDRTFRYWMHLLLENLRQGGDVERLLAGFELARDHDERHEFTLPVAAADVPVERIRRSVTRTDAPHLAMRLWEGCATLGTARVLRTLDLDGGPLQGEFLSLLIEPLDGGDLDPELRRAKASVIERRAARILDLVRSLPEAYARQALSHLSELSWFWNQPGILDRVLDGFLELLPRICRPPFRSDSALPRALLVLSELGPGDWDRARSAPESAFLRFDAACRRRNDADLIAGGLQSLCQNAGPETSEGFLHHPGPMLGAARVLGGLARSLRREILGRWKAHPLVSGLDAGATLGTLVDRLSEAGPVPRKLREAARGLARLSPGQEERGRALLRRSIPAARWGLLRRLALRRLESSVGPVPGAPHASHALRLYGWMDENRRALRRFLQAHFAGDRDYLLRHPLNRAWLAARRKLDAKAWLAGHSATGRLHGGGNVHLAVETDPLETLRLGTYAGTCTGLGGLYSFSAAAVLLDLNKRVVYARTEAGTVLARQILAISDDEHLVCFQVYPESAPPELRRLFKDFDAGLARRLGIEIWPSSHEEDPRIPSLLSQDWHDDGVWDPEPEA